MTRQQKIFLTLNEKIQDTMIVNELTLKIMDIFESDRFPVVEKNDQVEGD